MNRNKPHTFATTMEHVREHALAAREELECGPPAPFMLVFQEWSALARAVEFESDRLAREGLFRQMDYLIRAWRKVTAELVAQEPADGGDQLRLPL